MKYQDTVKLHSGDEVTVRGSETHLAVVEVENDKEYKECFILCNDGRLYHHTALK